MFVFFLFFVFLNKGSGQCFSLLLPKTFKADILCISSKSQRKLNQFAYTGQLPNYKHIPFCIIITCPRVIKALVLEKAERVWRYPCPDTSVIWLHTAYKKKKKKRKSRFAFTLQPNKQFAAHTYQKKSNRNSIILC